MNADDNYAEQDRRLKLQFSNESSYSYPVRQDLEGTAANQYPHLKLTSSKSHSCENNDNQPLQTFYLIQETEQ